jgi:flagellar motor switch protein FliM
VTRRVDRAFDHANLVPVKHDISSNEVLLVVSVSLGRISCAHILVLHCGDVVALTSSGEQQDEALSFSANLSVDPAQGATQSGCKYAIRCVRLLTSFDKTILGWNVLEAYL